MVYPKMLKCMYLVQDMMITTWLVIGLQLVNLSALNIG